MRPTLPLSDWRIAVDLDATKSARRQFSVHTTEGCDCGSCTSWRKVAARAFPAAISEQLRRLGVRPDVPTDIYAGANEKDYIGFRVLYHIVGKILSGPAPWLENPLIGTMHAYHAIQKEPTYVSLRVSTAKDSYEAAPDVPTGSTSDILCLDFRIDVTRV